MRRDYLDSMKADGFGEFLNACETLRNCKYIIADSKIAALLKSIADNKQLYSMFGAALYDFDYKPTFTECVGGNMFALPTDPKTAIALVFRILMDIDSGKMPLRNFLEAYFYNESINESYARFGLEVISPFESYCRMFISQADTENADMSQNYDNMSDKRRKDLKTDALACVAALIDYADTAINGVYDRAEYNACLNGLVRNLKSDETDGTISAYIGVKYAVAYFFKSNPDVNDIFKKLEYDIKHLFE
ncbi:MAG: hypothetical protein K2M48_03805 [Clostridiales bacterium]|nr:hypothetical protein [Clostridiales bacterium]